MLNISTVLALAAQCAPSIAPSTLASIVLTESEGNPFAIRVNSGPALRQTPSSEREAISLASNMLAAGANLDLGLAQINSDNLAKLGLRVENIFEPCTNLKAAAVILSDNYQRALRHGHDAPLRAALSAYNTGNFSSGIRNGYVARVFFSAREVVPVAPSTSVETVGRLLVSSFGGRITDTVRPQNASYGAAASYHKIGQAIDFVPAGGVTSISKDDIRSVLERAGIGIIELLGPGDPDHSDHFHIAFGVPQGPGVGEQPTSSDIAKVDSTPPAPPPKWDVFAYQQWQTRWGGL